MTVLSLLALAVGLLVLAQWAGNLITHRVPELETAPGEIYLHIAAELLMAGTLIAAGLLGLTGAGAARPLLAVGFGMTVYSIVNSAGYFVQRRETPPLVMFAVLFVLVVAAAGVLVSGV